MFTVQLTAQNISGHQLATLSQFKPATPQGGAVPQQQLLQLPQLQYKQIQIRHPQAAASPPVAKPKSKKRTTPTPPKQWRVSDITDCQHSVWCENCRLTKQQGCQKTQHKLPFSKKSILCLIWKFLSMWFKESWKT